MEIGIIIRIILNVMVIFMCAFNIMREAGKKNVPAVAGFLLALLYSMAYVIEIAQ